MIPADTSRDCGTPVFGVKPGVSLSSYVLQPNIAAIPTFPIRPSIPIRLFKVPNPPLSIKQPARPPSLPQHSPDIHESSSTSSRCADSRVDQTPRQLYSLIFILLFRCGNQIFASPVA